MLLKKAQKYFVIFSKVFVAWGHFTHHDFWGALATNELKFIFITKAFDLYVWNNISKYFVGNSVPLKSIDIIGEKFPWNFLPFLCGINGFSVKTVSFTRGSFSLLKNANTNRARSLPQFQWLISFQLFKALQAPLFYLEFKAYSFQILHKLCPGVCISKTARSVGKTFTAFIIVQACSCFLQLPTIIFDRSLFWGPGAIKRNLSNELRKKLLSSRSLFN